MASFPAGEPLGEIEPLDGSAAGGTSALRGKNATTWDNLVSEHALSVMRDVLGRIESSNGSMGGLADWMQETESFKTASLNHGSSDRQTFERVRRSFHDLEAASDLSKRLSEILGEQVEATKGPGRMKSLSLRHGTSSLPDDVLSFVLSYATRPDKLEEGVLVKAEVEMDTIHEALSLSHVCSRFRSLLLNNSRIWDLLSDLFADADMALHCVKYSKNALLDVFMDHLGQTHSGPKFEEVVSACLTASVRWKYLQFGESFSNDEKRKTRNFQHFSDNASAFSRLTEELEFPSLASLTFSYNQIPLAVDLRSEEFHPHRHWSLPSLEVVNFSGVIPLPFNNTARHISISYDHKRGLILDMHQLSAFFASCKSLQSVHLSFMGWSAPVPSNTAKIKGVKRIGFNFFRCTMDAVRTVCKALYFPDANEMTLQLDIPGQVQSSGPKRLSDYGVLTSEILLQHSYVGVKRLKLDFSPWSNREAQIPYLPPFTIFPHLEHLRLPSFFFWSHIRLLKIPDGVRIPALRTLTFSMELKDWPFVSDWVVALMARLKAQCDLDKFESLRIQELYHKNRKTSELEGAIHDYLPDHKIVIEVMDD